MHDQRSRKVRLLTILLFSLFAAGSLAGCTAKGTQQAYVMGFEESGLVWTTGTLFVKYKPEDTYDEEGLKEYCVDPTRDNYDELKETALSLVGTQTKVLLHFYQEKWVWPTQCNGETWFVRNIEVVE